MVSARVHVRGFAPEGPTVARKDARGSPAPYTRAPADRIGPAVLLHEISRESEKRARAIDVQYIVGIAATST